MGPGAVLDDRFELLSAIRGGALGDHWRALDRTTGEVVRLRHGTVPHAAELIAKHPARIVPLLACGTHAGVPFTVFSTISGTPLSELLRTKAWTLGQAVVVCRDLAAALADLHGRGIVHGGISPSRVLVDEDGAPWLLEPVDTDGGERGDCQALGALLRFAFTGQTEDLSPASNVPAPLSEVLRDSSASDPPLPRDIATRLAALTAFDAKKVIELPPRPVSPKETVDLSSGRTRLAWSAAPIGTAPTMAATGAVVAATPDLDRDAEAASSLALKPTDRYQLKSIVGQGGLGRVVLAHDRELNRAVAIKELLRRTPNSVARFRREALITARLQHPAIVPIHEAGRWPNGAPFYAMKLVEGDDLATSVRSCSTFAERLALLPKLITVCEAMAYAHAQRIIHRDLKPSNVVIGEFGETMIVDWGLAKDLDAKDDGGDDDTAGDVYRHPGGEELTRAGDVLGTPAYMAPEQAKGSAVDERTDVYALGAMLYHLLAGRAPYAEQTSTVTVAGFAKRGIRAVIDAPPLPLREQVPDASQELLAIVDKAMAREPRDRYVTARELADELQRFASGQLVGAHRYSVLALIRRWARRHRAVLVATAIALAALVAVGTIAIVRVVGAEQIAAHERDVAIAERRTADEQRTAAEDERNRLRLLQAESALDRDPTEALDWLAIDTSLPPELHERAVRIVRHAIALGVSYARRQLPGQIARLVTAGGRVAATSTGGVVAVFAVNGDELLRVSLGAPGAAVAVSLDGKQVVAASEDGRVRWWPSLATTPREIALSSPARAAAFIAPDQVALALADGSVQFWFSGGAVLGHRVHADEPAALLVRGQDVITASDDGSLARTRSTGPGWRIAAHAGGVGDALLDGNVVVSAGADGAIRTWNADDGRAEKVYPIGPPLTHVAREGDELIATSGVPAALHRRSIRHATTTVQSLPFPSGATCWPCGRWRIVGTGPRLNLESAGDVLALDGHRDKITTIVALASGGFVSGDRAGELRFWNDPAPVPSVAGHASSAPVASRDGWLVGLASGDVVSVGASGERTIVATLGKQPIRLVAASRNRDVIAAASDDRFGVWSAGKLVLDRPANALRIAVSDNGSFASLLGERGQVFDTRNGQLVVDIAEAREFVLATDRRAYAAVPGGVAAFDLEGPPPQQGKVHALAFDPNLGALLPSGGLVIGSMTGRVQLLENDTVGLAVDLGHQLVSLQVDQDWIVAGRGDGGIDRWRPSDNSRSELVGGHARWVHGLVPSPALGHLASFSWSAAGLRIWRPSDRSSTFVPTSGWVLGAAYNTAGEALLITDRSGAIRRVVDDLDRLAPIPVGGLATFVHAHLRQTR